MTSNINVHKDYVGGLLIQIPVSNLVLLKLHFLGWGSQICFLK